MQIHFYLILLLFYLLPAANKLPGNGYLIDSTKEDSLIFSGKVQHLTVFDKYPDNKLLVKTGESFLGTLYLGKTLEKGDSETLVINLREFDCTTFVESCMALSLAIKSEEPTFERFAESLIKIRYRDGKINGYTSRLHYFTEWISDNQKKGLITDITKELGGIPFDKRIDFMSTHPNSYMQLANDPSLIDKIHEIENNISRSPHYYIPKEEVKSIEHKLKDGMIVAITTSLNGLDIIHTGILISEKGRIHLLHASSDCKKVVISEKPLEEYLLGNKLQTGIMVLKVN